MPFKPSSWIQRTSAPFFLRNGTIAPTGNMIVDNSISFAGGPFLSEYAVNSMAATFNQAATWTTLVPADTLTATFGYFSITNPTDTRFFRFRYKFGRSFFVANSKIFAGYVKMDNSPDGISWYENQTFAEWGEVADVGGGQASHSMDVKYLFLPGSGPGGADADWIILSVLVTSPAGTPVNFRRWYRSDDFGFTWVFDRDESTLVGTLFFLSRATTGRLAAGAGALFYSDDNGVTWNAAAGALPPTIHSGVIAHAGGSFSIYSAGGVGSTPSAGVSCDGGANWQTSQLDLGPANTNINALGMGLVESLAMCRDSGGLGCTIWYSNDGGETFVSQGVDTRLPSIQAGVVLMGFFPDGAPLAVGANGVVLVSSDRPTGNFGARTLCPLAFAGLAKAGPPNLCGHPMLQNRC